MGFRSPLPLLGTSAAPAGGGLRGPCPALWAFSGGLADGEHNVNGNVQSQNATVAGVVNRFALRTISGGVQSQSATVSGNVLSDKLISGGVQSQSATVSGTLTKYPLAGYTLSAFTVDYAGLDTDSPFSGDPTYADILIGDECHFETLTDPSGSTMSMDGAGQFTISPPSVVIETFDFQIYDASDGTFGTSGTITAHPADADVILSGGVQSQGATVSGTLTRFDTHNVSGGVQSGRATVSGVIVSATDVTFLFGGVQSQSASVSGDVERVITTRGNVQSQSATVSGDVRREVKITGGVQSQSATVGGSVIAGTEILPPNVADVPRRAGKARRLKRKIRIRSLNRK